MAVLTELRQRGASDIFAASMDGLKELPEAVNAVFRQTLTQLFIAPLVRASLRNVSRKDAKEVVAALKRIYQSSTAQEGERALEAFEAA